MSITNTDTITILPEKHSSPAICKSIVSDEKGPRSLMVVDTDTLSEAQEKEALVLTYPDGGLRAWGVVLGGFLSQFCSFGYICAFGVYQDYYTRIYMTEQSPSAISWIGSVDSFLTISTGIIGGRLYDRGYCMHLLYGGALLTSISSFMLSFAKQNQYWAVFLCQGIGMGLGGGMIYVPSFAIVSQYFDKKRTMAMSITTAGVSLGSAVTPIMVNNLLAKPSLGFATVSRINAAFMTVILVISCLLMRPRLPPAAQQANVVDCLKRFSKDWAYIALTVGYTLFALGFFFPIFYLQLAATTNGLDENFAFYSLVILNACSFVIRLLCGVIARKVNVANMAIASVVVSGAVICAFSAIGSATSIIITGILYGISSGIYTGTMAPLATFLTDNEAELGLRIGIAFAISGLGELTGPPLMGALLTSEYHWWRPATCAGVLSFAAAGCFVAVKFIAHNRIKGK